MSPRARKEPAGDHLMTAGSCIKYTAAGGEWRECIQSGFWGVGSLKPEWACMESPGFFFFVSREGVDQ